MINFILKITCKWRFSIVIFATVNVWLLPDSFSQVTTNLLIGTIKTTTNESIDQSLVTLYSQDSTLIKATFTDNIGHFSLPYPKSLPAFLKVSHIGFQPVSVQLDSNTIRTPLLIQLVSTSIQLNEVTVRDKKSLFELDGDRVIVRLENTPAFAGRTLFDVLGGVPRVTTDPIAKSIAIDGKTGVQLFVNGKQQLLSPSEVVNYVQMLSSNAVSKIEVLTNPSSRYDAGSSGIILIQLKSTYKESFQGDLALTMGTGRYLKENVSLNLSFLTKKLSASFLYVPSNRPTYYSWVADQTFPLASNTMDHSGFSHSNQFNFERNQSQLIRTSVDLAISPKTSVGTVWQYSLSHHQQNPTADLTYYLSAPASTEIAAISQFDDHIQNIAGNINIRHELSASSNLSADFDLASYTNDSRSTATFIQQRPQPLSPETFHITYPNQVTIKTAKIDYQTRLNKLLLAEGGVKLSEVSMTNIPLVQDYTSAFSATIPLLSQSFAYHEYTQAGYGSISYSKNNWSGNTGLRVEHTVYHGLSTNQAVDRDYLNLFPTVSINYKTLSKYQISFSANRRIIRPAFDLLNPAYNYKDPLTLYTGNPLLLPQLTTSVQSTISTPIRVSLTLLFSKSHNRITEIVYRWDSTQATTLNTNINFNAERRWSATLSYPVKLNNNWSTQLVLTGHTTRYFSTFQNSPTQIEKATAILRVNNSFNWKKITANLNFIGRTPAVVGYLYYKPLWSVDAGIQRSLTSQSSLKIAATDVFHSIRIINYGTYLNTSIQFNHRMESQQVLVTYTYRFGNLKRSGIKDRALGAQSEIDRLDGSRK